MKEQYKWDFKDFFLSDEDFLDSFERLKKEIVDFKKDYEKFSIEERLSKYYALSLLGERLVSYSELHSDLDLKNETYLSYKNEVYTEKTKIDNIKGNINEEILKIELSLEEYMKNNPKAKPFYMHFYEVFRLKEHTINNNVILNESLLIQRVNSLYNTIISVEMPTEEMEIEGSLIKVNGRVYNKYIVNQDRTLRENVFKTYMKSLKNVNGSISSLFNMRYQLCFDIAKEKGYKSILDQVIGEDNLDMKILENLISFVHENLPLLEHYINLKKKKLGVEEFHFYDLNINSDYNPKYSFIEGIEIVKNALKDLGSKYESVLNQVLVGGMIDAFPNKHKFGGGYHFRNYTKPMILMNYKENFREVATIGHELGHAVNGILIRDNQEFQNFHFSIFLSEIPSTVNEDRVEEYMYKQAEKENKIIHLEQILDKTITAIFFQTMLLEFQKALCERIEKGEYVNAEEINQTFLTLLKEYYPSMTIDEESKYLWQTRLHMFYDVHRYYNFQYAVGKITALVINKNIKEGKINDYFEFLKVGGSKPTLEALSIAGIDLTKKEVYVDAFLYLERLLKDYDALLENAS